MQSRLQATVWRRTFLQLFFQYEGFFKLPRPEDNFLPIETEERKIQEKLRTCLAIINLSEQFLPELKQCVQEKIQNFKGGCIFTKLHRLKKNTSNTKILQTVAGLRFEYLKQAFANNIGMTSGQNSLRTMSEVKKFLNKGIVINTACEGAFISHIFGNNSQWD